MRILILLLLIQWLACTRAYLPKLCGLKREFEVGSCAACRTLDRTRGDIKMASCQMRENTSYCACGNFPDTPYYRSVSTVVYYAYTSGNGNETKCTNDWAMAPDLYIAARVVAAGGFLYAATHLAYIAVFSGMCSLKYGASGKVSASALLYLIGAVLWASSQLWRIAGQAFTIGISYRYVLDVLVVFAYTSTRVAGALLLTSVADTAYYRKSASSARCCVRAFFGILAGVTSLTMVCGTVVLHFDEHLGNIFFEISATLLFVTCVSALVFMGIAHRKMRQVSLYVASLACCARPSCHERSTPYPKTSRPKLI